VDDEIDDLSLLGSEHELGRTRVQPTRLDRLLRAAVVRLPVPVGEDERSLAYAEATARRLAARQTIEDLSIFDDVPGVEPHVVEAARETFRTWQREAEERLSAFDSDDPAAAHALQEAQVQVLARAEAMRAMHALTGSGILPERATQQPLP
jgi:hypothetical protein